MLKKSMIRTWADQVRVKHWIKNIFIFAPLMFSGKLFEAEPLSKCILGFIVFSMLASSIYLLNDLADIDRDKKHPEKKNRPIASGQISKTTAMSAIFFLITLGLGLSFLTNLPFFIVSVLYILNNIAYSFLLKKKVVADVISIAIGFMLRFLGGAYIIDVEASRWFLICAFSLSLFLGLGKRRTELEILGNMAIDTRFVMTVYTKEKLDAALACACAMSIVTYMLFATDPETLARHHSDKFIYTIPIVAYCVIRFMFKVQEGKGSGPVEILFKDKGFLVAGACWLIMALFIVYYL